MGPSGCGKTTLLNSLAGQLVKKIHFELNLIPPYIQPSSPSSETPDDVFPASVHPAQVSSKGLRLEGHMAVNGVEVADGATGIRKAYVRQVDGSPAPSAARFRGCSAAGLVAGGRGGRGRGGVCAGDWRWGAP